ncbi:MAG: hypothetical protein KJO98_01170 [Rhodothermia bacterium]|nr:hypothetical protein [Rhodothermia bacterium]
MDETDLIRMIKQMEASSSDATLSTSDRLADLRIYVTDQISRMLETDRGLLFSILYRIDVPERSVIECLSSSADGSVAERLADLVVTRQLQKIELRRRWGDNPKGDTNESKR